MAEQGISTRKPGLRQLQARETAVTTTDEQHHLHGPGAIMTGPATASPAMSQDSTVFGIDSTLTLDDAKALQRRAIQRVKAATTAQDILVFLVAFRILNALSIKTFFQPDEFFQSLEPAWELAFGANSGAWVTWEWKHQLRSAIHPALFAAVYRVAAAIAWALHLSPDLRANLLISAPKVVQAVCAALGDYYTWKLGERVFGKGSNEAWASLALTVCNPWQWFCSTRTLSNCLEMTLTVTALNWWPWDWCIERPQETGRKAALQEEESDNDYVHVGEGSPQINDSWIADQADETPKERGLIASQILQSLTLDNSLRKCLLLAALAGILRPTNVMIWICFGCFALFRTKVSGKFMEIRWVKSPIWVHVTSLELFPATKQQRRTLFRESAICGFAVLAFSIGLDLLYYRRLTLPPLRFLYFNIAQSLAVFYGRNRWDYYLTEGLPLLLTTYLPFGIIGIHHALSPPQNHPTFTNSSVFTRSMKYQFATTCVIVSFVLSLIAHKEIRFMYPLLPLLHLLVASPFTTFFLPAVSPAVTSSSASAFKRVLLGFMLSLNIAIGVLATSLHQTAPIAVMSYLRQQHTAHYLSQPPLHTLAPAPSTMTVGFLMPCHSTPWRSHLVFPSIKAWALGCEPPVNLNGSKRLTYVDEADQFYANPRQYLVGNLGRPPFRRPKPTWSLFGWLGGTRKFRKGFGREEMIEADAWDGKLGKKSWPEYLVFFEEKEDLLKAVLKGSAYRECWRGWNSYGHDDWRRRGDMIAWCLRSQRERKRWQWRVPGLSR